MVSGRSYNIIEIKVGNLLVREGLLDIRLKMLDGGTHECSDCPICNRVGISIDGPCKEEDPDNPTQKWCACKPYYDWDTLKDSLVTEGYQYSEGYIMVKKINNTYGVIEGNHRVILLNEIYGGDYIVNVKVITPKSDAMYTNNVKS